VRDGGRLILATPLPLDPSVFEGPRTVDPREPLPLRAESWESALVDLVSVVLEPMKLAVEAFTRVPYLSRGDARHELYLNHDAVVVLRR